MYRKTCRVCGTEFISVRHNAVYCTDECRAYGKEEIRERFMSKDKDEYGCLFRFKEPKSMKHLREVVKKVDKEGKSYGYYMADHKNKGKR